MKKYMSFVLCVVSGFLTAGASETQPVGTQDPLIEETINRYLREVQISKETLPAFFTDIFDTDFYVERFFPSCFIHCYDFFNFGLKHKKPCAFASSSLALFTQRLHACTWVNPYALLDLLEKLPDLLGGYCAAAPVAETREIIKKELRIALLDHFDELKEDPDLFLEETAQKIDAALGQSNGPLVLRELQSRLVLFLSCAISRLIWNPQEKLDVWNLVTATATKLQVLYDIHLLATYDDLNILLWALLYRFGYFIDCAGSQLPASCYQTMQNDLVARKYIIFALAEPESSLVTKEAYLQKVIMSGLAKAEAAEKGIFVGGLI